MVNIKNYLQKRFSLKLEQVLTFIISKKNLKMKKEIEATNKSKKKVKKKFLKKKIF